MDLKTSEYSRVAKIFYHKALEVMTKAQSVLVTVTAQRTKPQGGSFCVAIQCVICKPYKKLIAGFCLQNSFHTSSFGLLTPFPVTCCGISLNSQVLQVKMLIYSLYLRLYGSGGACAEVLTCSKAERICC